MAAYIGLSALSIDGAGGPDIGVGGPRRRGDRPVPLVLLHGFTQSGASWGPLVGYLGGRLPLVLPDAPGHGGSAHVVADLWATADLLAGLVPGPAFWAGYSMGGRMALHLALAHPERVERLVLLSTGAGIEDHAARAARRAADEDLARRIEDEGVETFLSWWLSQPLFATLSAERSGQEARLVNTAPGLASSLRTAGTGAQEPLWHRLGELRDRHLPVLLVAGERDARYRDQARRMAAAIGPSASLMVVPGAGHACHLEQPEVVAAALVAFCATGTGTGTGAGTGAGTAVGEGS
jgi:2-succinyl-6-hydroxy-2,4-cyclohexadiene-1-carboxylate synthase